MANILPSNLTLKDYPSGAGEVLAATTHGTFLVVLWTAAAADVTARIRKAGDGPGVIVSAAYQPGTTATLGWTSGALTVATAGAVHRYGTVIKI